MDSRFRIPGTVQASLNRGPMLWNSKHGRSLPVLSPKNIETSHIAQRQEIEEVEYLTTWNSISAEELQSQQQAEHILNQYRSKYTEMDQLFMQRKARSSLPSLGSRPASDQQLRHILEISTRRAEKQNQEQMIKEHAKFSRRYEDDLAARAAALQAELEGVMEQREMLRRKNTRLREQLTESDIAIKNFRAAASRQENVLKSKMKTLRSEDLSYIFSKRSACQLELVTKEQEYQETVMRLNDEIIADSAETAKLDVIVKEARHKLLSVQKSLVDHYRKILAEGVDTRSEGLAWVVKALWKLNQKVEAEMFPPFLDLESIHIIIFVAQKSIEISELSEYVAQVQNTTRMSLISQSRHSALLDVSERLSSMKCPIKTTRTAVSKPLFADRTAQPDSISPLETEEAAQPSMTQTKPVEDRINGLKMVIQTALEQELKRIARECFMNSLEQKTKVSARQMLAAIAGVDALCRIMPVITKEQKELADDLRKAKTFSFAANTK